MESSLCSRVHYGNCIHNESLKYTKDRLFVLNNHGYLTLLDNLLYIIIINTLNIKIK